MLIKLKGQMDEDQTNGQMDVSKCKSRSKILEYRQKKFTK